MPHTAPQPGQLSLLKELSKTTLDAIQKRSIPRTFKAGQCLVHEGFPAEVCFFLVRGVVRVFRTSLKGRVQVLTRLEDGQPVNIISLLKKTRTNHATIEALTDVSALALSSPDFFHLLKTCRDFSRVLLEAFAERLARMTDLASELSLLSVRTRLARFLIALAEKPQTAGGWTQDEIAAQIGTVRDVVGRILRDMETEGLIQRKGDQILLLNRQNLLREAEMLSN